MKLLFQCFLLIVCLLIGVIFGIDVAENGIYRINGNPEKPTQAFHVTKIEEGDIEVSVLGKKYSTETEGWQQKVDEIQEERLQIEVSNPLSAVGNRIGDWLTKWTRAGIDRLFGEDS